MSNTNIKQHSLPIIRCLTSLRFFAALIVFASHYIQQIPCASHALWIKFIYNRVFYEGYIGVTFFFILSGFILTYNYDNLVEERVINTKGFLLLRAARIYPTHLLTFILSLLLVSSSLPNFLSAILSAISLKGLLNLFLLQSFIPQTSFYFSFNAVSWSISTEAFFYLLCCSILAMSYKKMLKINLTILILVIVSLLLVPHVNSNMPNRHWLFYINPFFRLFDFIFGIALAKTYFLIKKRGLTEKISKTSLFKYLEVLSILLLAVFIFIALRYNINQSLRYDLYYTLPMGVIIFIFAFEKGWFSKILSKKIFVFLGEISFSMYMFHYLMLQYMANTMLRLGIKAASMYGVVITSIIMLSIIILISSISFLYFEKPLNKILRKVWLPHMIKRD